ncbi:MAG TPA: dTMP kinase [Gammaproteobacteria bacterium]|nr:dTMP kinase [Gammaproteobacteria bacterium]
MQTRQNKFITIEGIEGVGKTTAVRVIQDYLTEHLREFIVTREPGGTVLAEEIRQMLLNPLAEKVTPEAELLLMFASRAQHIARVIQPALDAQRWVISDRFVDASYAYQGGGRQVDLQKIQLLDEWIVGSLQPQLTFLLDAPPNIGLLRAKNRGAQDRIEQETMDFFERVRAVYLQRASRFPERFCVVDATAPLETVREAIIARLDQLFTSAHHAH